MAIVPGKTDLNTLIGIPKIQYWIPPYQRPYSWMAEQIDELWDDLIASLGRGHFMGTLVIAGNDKLKRELIDGQQRLTTLVVLLALIRDEYQSISQEDAGSVQQYLETRNVTGEDRFKLKSGAANWPIFRDFILRAPGDRDRKKWSDINKLTKEERHRNARLIENTERLQEKLGAWLAPAGEDGKRASGLKRLEAAIIGGLEFVEISVPDVEAAFVIFETLNDRGLELSAGDLLKNHLLSRASQAGRQVEELASDWDGLLDLLNGADVTRFLRHFLLISNQRVQKDDVFAMFKQAVAGVGVTALLTELKEMAKWYGEFVKPGDAEDGAVRTVLEDLATLRATVCYSALMPARRYLSVPDFVSFARLAEALTYRYSTICSKDSKELERGYHRAAKAINESKGKDLERARKELIGMLPTSEEFRGAFERQSMGQKYVLDYSLRKLEAALDTEKRTGTTVEVHLEHIMPQTLSEAWRVDLGAGVAEHEAFVDRWGNLTLLGGKKNQSASNQAFSVKRAVYATSSIRSTQQLATLGSWGLTQIEDRQREMALLADQVWGIPKS
jgi:hypothetical protein